MARPVVHIVDDDPTALLLMGAMLDAGGLEARAYGSAEAFLATEPPAATDCLLTDMRLPGLDGLELIRRLQTRGAAPPILVVTAYADVPLAVEAVRAGALDVLEKPVTPARLTAAVAAALDQSTAPPPVPSPAPSQTPPVARLARLSGREREVLRGVAAGRGNKVIAQDLGISPRTVEVYRAHLMAKTGTHTVADLLRLALAAGY